MIDLRLGNVLDVLAQMPSESVHCIVTSPPYWGLRAYGTEPQVWRNGSEPCQEHEWETNEPYHRGQVPQTKWANVDAVAKGGNTLTNTCTRCGAWRGELGLEPTPELFVEHIVAVMREARRVLRADGTLWLNIGDSYAANGAAGRVSDKSGLNHGRGVTDGQKSAYTYGRAPTPEGLKPKDLVGIPWRVAFALQADGWYLRSDIIWHKPNPMPESVRDRPTKAHEYIFLMSKSPKYFYDADAVAEPANYDGRKDEMMHGGTKYNAPAVPGQTAHTMAVRGHPRWNKDENGNRVRNRRSVWMVTTHPYTGAHFATFPPKLIEPCILASTSQRGVCSKCGAPWVRVVEKAGTFQRRWSRNNAEGSPYQKQGSDQNIYKDCGWRASCACDAGEPVPATVLDPFGGSGTTALVAAQHGRDAILIDLKREYLEMARERISAGLGAFADIHTSYDVSVTA